MYTLFLHAKSQNVSCKDSTPHSPPNAEPSLEFTKQNSPPVLDSVSTPESIPETKEPAVESNVEKEGMLSLFLILLKEMNLNENSGLKFRMHLAKNLFLLQFVSEMKTFKQSL